MVFMLRGGASLGQSYVVGTTSVAEASAAGGSDSIALAVNPSSAAWTASANDSWLHLSASNQSGLGSTNIVFQYDSNSSHSPRVGSLTIAGIAVTVSQASGLYLPANSATGIVVFRNGVGRPSLDAGGNVYYISDGSVKKWNLTNNTVSTLISYEDGDQHGAIGIACDAMGNVYFQDLWTSVVREWIAATGVTNALFTNSHANHTSITLDNASNVYVTYRISTTNGIVTIWNESLGMETTLVSNGLVNPVGVAADLAGNLYIADSGVIKVWNATSGIVKTLVSKGLSSPNDVAVDIPSGNIFIADSGGIYEWIAASQSLTTVTSGCGGGLSLDKFGNVYFLSGNDFFYNDLVEEFPRWRMGPVFGTAGAIGGVACVANMVPTNEVLFPPLIPTVNASWLNFAGVTNGQIFFNFTSNKGASRSAQVTFDGLSWNFAQAAFVPPALFNPQLQPDGTAEFDVTNIASGFSYSVWSAPDLSMPVTNWMQVESFSNSGSGTFHFIDPEQPGPQRFFMVRSP
jgi:hypothetical protein